MNEVGPKTILIVEDEMLTAMEIREELLIHGYTVLGLVDRRQGALGLAMDARPDLALVNICLAHGDDGVALARELKALGVPVLFISGQPVRARLARAVAVASLAKPYTGEEMAQAVDYLFRHELGDESQPRPPRLEMFDSAWPDDTFAAGSVSPNRLARRTASL